MSPSSPNLNWHDDAWDGNIDHPVDHEPGDRADCHGCQFIAAIEAQARSDALLELRGVVEGLPGWRDPRYSGRYESKGLIGRAAVLSAIDHLVTEPTGSAIPEGLGEG